MALERDQARRLGEKELGPYAYEDNMPDRLHRVLRQDGSDNIVTNIIPKLARLLDSTADVKAACLCHEGAVLVHKLATEGNTFCGYRNIQMMLLAVGARSLESLQILKGIPELQDMIEYAWVRGFNTDGRVQTGGIKDTRKHIGSPEAEALLQSLDIACTGSAFEGQRAVDELLTSLGEYFGLGDGHTGSSCVRITDRLPVFLQRPKHSILVVGIARRRDDSQMLLVFDPARPPPFNVNRMPKSKLLQHISGKLQLAAFARSETSLRRYVAFETVSVDAR